MEDFLTALDNLVDSLEDVTAIEVLGALELVKQRLAFDMLADEEEEGETCTAIRAVAVAIRNRIPSQVKQ
jgi:hypothetical protein